MDYTYVALAENKKMVRGKVSAASEEAAANLLSYGGYQVISVRPLRSFINTEKLNAFLYSKVSARDIVMFSRQLALLLEAGSDIVASLQLLQAQATNRTLRNVLGKVAADIQGGSSLSTALGKQHRAFSPVYARAIAAGEQGGSLEIVLRQLADDIDRRIVTEKKIKGALTYPIIVVVVAVIVIILIVTFVLPAFTQLYSGLGVTLPLATRMLISITNWFSHNGVYVLGAMIVGLFLGVAYSRTKVGRYQLDKLLLSMPILGRTNLLGELSRCCRTMSLLFKVGLPLPDVMTLLVQSSNNKVVAAALAEVQKELVRGEGLSKPMAKDKLFLPLMVAMIRVGEETGGLDRTLATVAETYEADADDRMSRAVALIQPAITVVIGAFVAFLALSMISAMYSLYGQFTGA